MISRANVKNIYPLSPLQEGILFHALHDAGGAYFEQLSYRIRGRINPDVFRAAWEELVRRHDVLRTIFVHKDIPRPLQIVLKQWRIDFSAVDLRKLARGDAEAKIVSLKEEDRATPFNLAKDPLTRVKLISLADDEAEVVWSHHHIILDGWSAGILQGELLEVYTALKLGRNHNLPEPDPFSGYITWIGRQDQEASRRFWREYLEGYSQTAGIPRFPHREPAQAGRGNLNFRLDSKISEFLTTLAARNGVTLNVLLQALWGILLCRLNGLDEAVFAATVSGRPDELKGIEKMVGIFINAVPVRIMLNRGATFSELLKAHQAATLAASRHHWCSLADIQAESFLKQTLLDHILIFENFPLDERIADDERLDERGFNIVKAEIRGNTNYPFELSIIPGSEIEFKMGYDPAVYDHAQIERATWSLEQLIDTLRENQHAPLAGLSILSPREKELILRVFNRPQGGEAGETVADVLERRAAEHPDGIALVFEAMHLAYRELNEAANRVANHLQQQCGVRPDQVVGILMDRSERMMAGLLGIIKSGAAYLPLDPAFPAARISYMLEDSGCRVLLTERKYRRGVTGISLDTVIIELDQLPGAPTTNPPRSTGPDNLLYLIYTSGSAGLPKGVMLEQRNVISFNRNMAEVYGLAPGDAILALTTITFDISVLELICSLMSGMTVVLASDAIANNPARAAALLGEKGVDVLQITPSRLALMLEEAELSILSGLKALLVGGEPLPGSLFERLNALPDTAVFNAYGPTEATIWSTTKKLNNADLTIGVPLVDEEVLILTPDGGQILPVGVWGEICIGGQGLARGYWNRPELTLDRFIPHPVRPGERIYRTGDLGRFLPDGDIQCGGRMDNQVKVRGYRIETGEIEQSLLKIPGIREAVAHIVEIDGVNEITAYLVPEGETIPAPAELQERLAEYLPDYMLPTYYVPLKSVPLTPNGKTDRKALPLPTGGASGAGLAGGGTYLPPRTETEAGLAAIWQRILGVELVGVNDNFFDLGGHSIKAIRIASAITKEFGLEIPLSLIFQNPVLASLAAALAGKSAADQTLLPLPPQQWYETAIGQELTVGTGGAPATTMEKRLAAIWEQILGCKGVSRHDSFFEIGGQSITAIRVAAAIREQLGVHLPLPTLLQHASLYELARECERTAFFAEDQHLLLNQGSKVQLFAFPPITGYPIAYSRLAKLLDDVSFHGFTFIESDDRLQRYLELINQLQPNGPLTLLGYSSGGNLAFEMAKELERHGRTVLDLILLDSWKRLQNAPVSENLHEWIDEYSPDPALFGNPSELTESPHIREIAFGKLRRYLAYTESLTTEGIISAAIHLLCADETVELEGLSQEWRVHTAAVCKTYDGVGSHLAMLKEPWVEENASVINSLLKKGVE
jgi:amino acid adenylation domain-containing protein